MLEDAHTPYRFSSIPDTASDRTLGTVVLVLDCSRAQYQRGLISEGNVHVTAGFRGSVLLITVICYLVDMVSHKAFCTDLFAAGAVVFRQSATHAHSHTQKGLHDAR